MKKIYIAIMKFDRWFTRKFGWLFTNGMKAIHNKEQNRSE